MRKIFFATGNKGKAREAEYILGQKIEIANLELEEIQSLNHKKIVTHKLHQAFAQLQSPVIVDDVSLEIDAWDGFPGPFVKFMHQDDNDHFLKMLRHESDRGATLIATIGYHDGSKTHCFTGKIRVQISNEIMGERGWGLDPVLIPEGEQLTLASMSEERKNSLSHRRKALVMLKSFLDKNDGL